LPVVRHRRAVGSTVGAAVRSAAARLVQRTDDNQAVVLERLKVYHRQSSRWSSTTACGRRSARSTARRRPIRVAADLARRLRRPATAARR
jgi:adenylate kinase family enzyme